MDALEFYIGELEAALNAESTPERPLKIEEAARAVIVAWDAENTPDEEA